MLLNRRACGMEQQMQPYMAMPTEMPGRDGCGCGCNPCGGCEVTCCPPIECPCDPVMDPPVERVVRRDIIHNIQHIDPVNTRVINNHIFRHSYTPHYTCCEENICTTEQSCGCNPCGNPCGYSGCNF